jgi:pyruvate/2-oxoglutarate dehydrogenase complex dihydrolipoamide acyltransferase (E2) component
MGMQDGTIVEWLKREGDEVVEGEPIVDVDAEKAVAQVVAPVSGRLLRIVAQEGETVPVRTVIAVIE